MKRLAFFCRKACGTDHSSWEKAIGLINAPHRVTGMLHRQHIRPATLSSVRWGFRRESLVLSLLNQLEEVVSSAVQQSDFSSSCKAPRWASKGCIVRHVCKGPLRMGDQFTPPKS
eukprot:4024347-Amphidinium_carterae.1